LKLLLTIVRHSDDLSRTPAFNTFHIAIDHLLHGYRIRAGEIGFILINGIFDPSALTIRRVCFPGLLVQKVFLADVAGGEMENGKMPGAALGRQFTSLPGGEVMFFSGKILLCI
jgi:hypothetical protein